MDNCGDTSLSDRLAINHAEFVQHTAERLGCVNTHTHTPAPEKRELKGWSWETAHMFLFFIKTEGNCLQSQLSMHLLQWQLKASPWEVPSMVRCVLGSSLRMNIYALVTTRWLFQPRCAFSAGLGDQNVVSAAHSPKLGFFCRKRVSTDWWLSAAGCLPYARKCQIKQHFLARKIPRFD